MNEPEYVEFDLADILGGSKEPSKQQLTLYIPNKDRNDHQISGYQKWVKDAQKVLTLIGGGSTTWPPADGSWLDPEITIGDIIDIEELDEKLIVWERTTIMYTYINPDRFERYMPVLRKFLHKFGRETNQGEVVFEFDGEFFRIGNYDPE